MRDPATKRSVAFKKGRKEAITFDVKGRFEFLNGFSKRKAERKKKGNLINLKKEQRRKREEANQYKQHIQSEYEKVIDAVRHNYGQPEPDAPETRIPVVEEQTMFFPKGTTDPFGDVSVQISSLESHNFTSLSRALHTPQQLEPEVASTKPKPTGPPKAVPAFAKFKRLARSSKFLQKRKTRAKEGKNLTKVKKDARGKKKSRRKSR